MKEIVERFKNLKVLVVGDVMMDAYVFGNVDRISPEAPVPIIAVESKEKRLGGAANVAMNIVSLGAKPILCSVIGDDFEASEILQLMESKGISTSGILKSKSRVTTVKTRVIAQNHQMLRIDNEITENLNQNDSDALSKIIINDLLPGADVLIFQDYDKGVLSSNLIAAITKAAIENNVPITVDPKRKNFMFYKGATLFKPNLKELREGYKKDFDISNRADFEEVITTLMNDLELKNCMITMSEHGVMISDSGNFQYIPAHFRQIADVSGAGDTVISVASLCVALGLNNKQTAELANLSGGLVCEEVGVVPISKAKLIEEIEKLGLN